MIVEDDKLIKINGKFLLGLITDLEIKNSAILEDLEIQGKGKKPKQATGFEDATISISLSLIDDFKGLSKEEKLLSIQNLFRQQNQKIPNVYDVVNKHINQRGIYKVILKDLSTKESNKKNEISVSISLVEYEAVKITVKSNSSLSTYSSGKAITSSTELKSSFNDLNIDYLSYLDYRGIAPKKEIRPKQGSITQETLLSMSTAYNSSKFNKSPIKKILKGKKHNERK